MTPERYHQIERVFHAARERTLCERPAFLEEACGDDTELRAQVEAMLARDGQCDQMIDTPALGAGFDLRAAEATEPDALIGRHVARYRITRLLASGGMGAVYEAVQEHPQRRVALKLVKVGLGSPSALRRLKHEAEILGRLRHPGIAQVYEAGAADTGFGEQPFFAMELIHGHPLTQYVDERKLGTLQRLELLANVCDAVHHAHQKGVIHRDLKPANILVDESGKPKVLDFGVARASEPNIHVTTIHTHVGQLVGTLAYMSPEQIAGDPGELDTRSDVYSLGVVMYELLCEELPYKLDGASVPHIARIIHEQPPRRPSSIQRKLRGDVETVTLKAIEKDRERRYQSTAELAADIRRFLNREPISARRPTLGYQLRMILRRHPGLAASVLVATLALAGAAAVSSVFAWRADAARKREAERASEAIAARDQARVAQDRATVAEDTALRQAYIAHVMAAEAAVRDNNAYEAKRHLHACAPELRNWEWRHLAGRADMSLMTLRGHEDDVQSVEFSPDGRRILSSSGSWLARDYSVRLWDARTGEQLWMIRPHNVSITCVAFSPDGRRFATASTDHTARIFDTATRQELHTLRGHTDSVSSAAFSPKGGKLVTGSRDQTVRIWDVETGSELTVLKGHRNELQAVAFSPDGARLVSASNDNTSRIWNLVDRSCTELIGHSAAVSSAGFDSVTGSRVVTGSSDATVRVWDATTGNELHTLSGHRGQVFGVAMHPDGKRIASASADGTIKVWDTESGECLATLRGHDNRVLCVRFSPDGSRLVSGSTDRTIKVWDVTRLQDGHTIRGHTRLVAAVAFSPDGSRLASMAEDNTVRLWDVAEGTQLATPISGPVRQICALAFSPDGSQVAAGHDDGTTAIIDTPTWRRVASFATTVSAIRGVAYSPDGRWLASASHDGTLKLWELPSRRETRTIHAVSGHNDVEFTSDSRRFAAAGQDGTIMKSFTQSETVLGSE